MKVIKISALAVDLAVIYTMIRFIKRSESVFSIFVYGIIICLALVRLRKDWQR